METPVTDAALDESEQRCDAVVWAAAGCAAAACAATARRGSWARSLPAWLLLSLKVELRCSANDAMEMPATTPEMLRTLCCLRGWLEDDTMRGRCCYLRPPPSLGRRRLRCATEAAARSSPSIRPLLLLQRHISAFDNDDVTYARAYACDAVTRVLRAADALTREVSCVQVRTLTNPGRLRAAARASDKLREVLIS